MINRYFFKDENFYDIISDTLGSKDIEYSQISTGWTNIVFKVLCAGDYYIFRFPRNDYWADVIENEFNFNKFLTTKTNIPTSKMNLEYHNGRPFSYHKMIEGDTLYNLYDTLSKDDKRRIAKQLANFLIEFQNIKFEDVPMKIETTSKFLENLSKIEKNEYDLSRHNFLVEKENSESQVLSHGDLNGGNILIDENKNICAILDFAFISKSSRVTDLARIIGRLPEDFAEPMLDEYNKLSKLSVDKDDILKLIDVYNYVDSKYIEFMRIYYPEISIPD